MDLLIELPAVDIGHSCRKNTKLFQMAQIALFFSPTTSIYSSLNSD